MSEPTNTTLRQSPEDRVSCALEGTAVCQRVIGRWMAMHGLTQAMFTSLEMDLAPVAHVKRDAQGNVYITREGGS